MTRCRRGDLAAIFVAALVLRTLAALPQQWPGYMDAAYYTLGAQRLAQGHGFSEMILWNYLDDPAGLPHPSHLYWMPLPSVLAAVPMTLAGTSYRVAQSVFVLLAALLPPLAYLLSWALAPDRRRAWLAAGLMLFSGYYVIFWGVPESFTPFALAGAACLFTTGLAVRDGQARWAALAGACAALGHLSRADGVLLIVATVIVLALGAVSGPRIGLARSGRLIALALAAYLAVMAPWLWRNWQATGELLPRAGTATLWLRSYDELFSYGGMPDAATYLEWGWQNIAGSKLRALGANTLNFVAVNNLVALLPLVLAGLRRLWRHPLVLPALLYGALMYAAMTFAFTFPGTRGGALHSSSALLPALFALAAAGLDETVAWIARRRRTWRAGEARAVFSVALVLLAALVSAWLYSARVLGAGGLTDPAWNHTQDGYARAGEALRGAGLVEATVMVNDPPSFTYLTGYPSVAVVNEPLPVLLAAARRYGVTHLLLDNNRPGPLAGVYDGTLGSPALREFATFDDAAGNPVKVWLLEPQP